MKLPLCVLAAVRSDAPALKLPGLIAASLKLVTTTGPVVTPLGATAVICVALLTVTLAAAVPLKVTVNGTVGPV